VSEKSVTGEQHRSEAPSRGAPVTAAVVVLVYGVGLALIAGWLARVVYVAGVTVLIVWHLTRLRSTEPRRPSGAS
jgi:hypothetical protein